MNQKIIADLHNHTTASDGDFPPRALIKEAKSLGLKAVGVTDHDTINGVKSAVEAGKKYDIEVIPGVEVSVRFKETNFVGTLHVLCYFSPTRLADDQFMEQMNLVLSQGRGDALVKARIKAINQFFGPDSDTPQLSREMVYDDIAGLSSNASRRHFAMALNQTFGITDPEAVTAIVGNNSPAYLPSGIDFEAAMGLAGNLDLLSVLAHPAAGSFPGEGHYKEVLPDLSVVEGLLPRFVQGGIKGLEVYYPGHIKEHESLMKKWADTHGLLVTGGSDCHDAKDRPMGVAGIDQADFERFKGYLK